MACNFQHTGKFGLMDARVRIVDDSLDEASIPVLCLQCEEKHCEAVCPVGAFEDGAINEDVCIGCLACVEACPYGCIRPREDRSPVRCNVCTDDPPCAKICPSGAIRFVEDSLETRYRLSLMGKYLKDLKTRYAP